MKKYIALVFMLSLPVRAAEDSSTGYDMLCEIDANGDTIPYGWLDQVIVVADPNDSHVKKFWKTVRNVKKTMPYARAIAGEVARIDSVTSTLPQSQRKSYMKEQEDKLVDSYKPKLKKLTLRQGKLLIRLVDRECSQTSYALIKEYRGGTRAFFWQSFARVFGANLKSTYDSEDESNKTIENAIKYLEQTGQI